MNLYNVLKADTTEHKQGLYDIPIIRSAMAGQVNRLEYIEFLTQAYHHVKHTVPLLMACGSRLPDNREWLREAMAEYIAEELGHQEWILNDIEAAGGDAVSVRNGKPNVHTEIMVSYAYDTIMRGNPVGFLGMVYVLEHTSVELATAAADTLKSSLGLPNEAFSYLYSHGSLDLQHLVFFESQANRIDSTRDRDAVIHAAKVFYQLYGNIFRSISETAPQRIAA